MRSFKSIQEILPPLPVTLPEIKRIYLLGSTGAGKTSIVKNIIGTSALNFPITTQTRTTLATTEYVIKNDLAFKTTIILKQKEDVLDSIEELIQETIQKTLENKRLSDIDYITEKLQESSDERFRLRYMINEESIKNHAINISQHILPLLKERDLDDETLFSGSDVGLKISQLKEGVLNEIEDTFHKLCNGSYKLFEDEIYYIKNITDKNEFIQKNKELLKNEFGSISLLVDYVRIEGNLLADWLDNTLEFVLIDGEGIAHSLQEKRDTLSTRHYDYFDFCNQIILVEKGDDPFISGGQAAIESILLNGYKNKFKLIYSKIDKIENTDKNSFLRKRLENLKSALKQKKITLDIENKDSYRLENLNSNKTTEYTKKQIKKLLKNIHESEDCEFISLEYDFSTLFLKLDTTWFNKNFEKDLDSEHWAVIKAFSKRMYNQEGEYRHIKPISFIHTFIMKDIDLFLKREDQTIAEIYNSKNIIKQQFSKQLLDFIRQKFMIRKNYLWQQAFEKKGIGSNLVRKEFISGQILNKFLPRKNEIDAFNQFREDIKRLLLESGANEIKTAKKIAVTHVSIKKIFGHKNFEWALDPETNILIGKNGSGKSTILKLIYACIDKDIETIESKSFSSPSIELTILQTYDNGAVQESKIKKDHSMTNIQVVLVNTFDIKYDKRKKDIIDLDSQLLDLVSKFGEYQRSLSQIVNKKVAEQKTKRDELLQNISTASPEELNKFQKLSIEINNATDEINKPLLEFKTLIDNYFSASNKSLIIDNEVTALLVNIEDKLKPIEVTDLSSGEKQLLIIFLTVILQKDNPFILLMDEPETSLHVEWQSSFIDNIKQLNANIQIIIATHNPLIALNRKQGEIGTIEIDSDVVKVEGTGTKYLDVSAILLNYFHLSSLVGAEMRYKLQTLFDLKMQESLSDEEVVKLDELEKELGGTLATNFIYDRHYLQFLKFIKENHDIDFDKLTEISKEEMDALLGEFKELFDD